MNNVSENEDGKGQKEEEGSEDFEGEAEEDVAEGSMLEEASLEEDRLPFDSFADSSCFSNPASEPERRSDKDSYIEKRMMLLKEKWLSVPGRKPKNIPNMKRIRAQQDEEEKLAQVVFFGDRSPAEIERRRREKWLKLMAEEKGRVQDPDFGHITAEVRLPAMCEGLMCVRFDRNGDSLSTAYRNGVLQVRNLQGEVVSQLRVIESTERVPLRALRYHPIQSNTLYSGGDTGFVQTFNTNTTELIGVSDNLKQINNVDISPDGQFLVTTGKNGMVCVLDCATLEVISNRVRPNLEAATTSEIDDEYHFSRVYGLKCHPTDPNIFLTGGWDCTVKIWDFRTPTAIHSIRGPVICGEGVDVKDDVIVTSSWVAENALQLWNLPSGKLIKTVPIKTKETAVKGGFLYAVCYFDEITGQKFNGNVVFTGGSGFDETIAVNIDSDKVLARFPSHKGVLALDTLGNRVAYGGKESLFRLGELGPPRRKSFRRSLLQSTQ